MTLHSRDVTARVAFNTNYFEGFIYLYIYIYSDPLHTLLQAFIVRPWPLFGWTPVHKSMISLPE